MIIRRTRVFKKQYRQLPIKLRQKFDEQLRLFAVDQTDIRLRVHPLKAKYAAYWSIDISSDLRALFCRDGETGIIFGFIGSLSQLYV